MFAADLIYVRIDRNHMRCRNVRSQREYATHAADAFTTSRLLVGDFRAAESCLTECCQRVRQTRLRAPRLIIQPLTMIEGGLSPVEERVLMELGAGAGARKTIVHIGSELSDTQARNYRPPEPPTTF